MASGKKLLLSLSVLPSGCGSAYQMAAEWIDSFQGDLSLWWFWQLCFCSVWGRCPAERGEQTLRYAQLSAQLSARPCSLGWSCYHTTLRQYTFYGPWIKSFLWSLNKKSKCRYCFTITNLTNQSYFLCIFKLNVHIFLYVWHMDTDAVFDTDFDNVFSTQIHSSDATVRKFSNQWIKLVTPHIV